MNDPNWRDRAVCASVDSELFFPWPDGEGERAKAMRRPQEEAAKRVCAGCPVRHECLREAIRYGHVDGVWGGLSAEERRPLRGPEPKRKANHQKQPMTYAQCGTEAGRAVHTRNGERPCEDCRIADGRARARRPRGRHQSRTAS